VNKLDHCEPLTLPFRGVILVAIVVSLTVLLSGLALPLADLHSFRQSQTAISAYWLLHGGPLLDYWTPVLGPPWTAPFEFPLFQWIVAALVRATSIPLDMAGRLTSYAWLILALYPARGLAQDFRLPRLTFPIFATLYLLSPVYLFWGRSFLIETQAVTLSLLFLWWGCRAIERKDTRWLVLSAAAGVLAMLTKITTALPFAAAVAGLSLIRFVKAPRRLVQQPACHEPLGRYACGSAYAAWRGAWQEFLAQSGSPNLSCTMPCCGARPSSR